MVIVTVPALFECFQKLPHDLYESIAYDVRKILRRVLSWNFQNLTREEVLALLPNISPSIFCRLFLKLLVSKSCVVVMLVFSVLSIQIAGLEGYWLAFLTVSLKPLL